MRAYIVVMLRKIDCLMCFEIGTRNMCSIVSYDDNFSTIDRFGWNRFIFLVNL